MARHARITQTLEHLKDNFRVVEGWAREADPNDPTRVRWVLYTGPGEVEYLSTAEVEAFIKGAQAALRSPVI